MDLGPDPIDHDELIQRYGRRLFVLAYHLTGRSAEAEELCRECLIRSLLAPDFPAADKEAGVFLHRGLISLWRERAGLPGRAAESAPGGHAVLFRALSRLDPVSRAVLVLRVAEGLEYETIGKVLDMAPDVVYARLLQARGGLREGERALETSLFETMNLYLDGRLPPDRRGAFERRMQIDSSLRERVEFHRGLTLELHEEAPALPRDFIARLREQLEKMRETLLLVDQATEVVGLEPGSGPPAVERIAPPAGRHLSPWAAVAGAVIFLIVGVGLGLWMSRRRADGATEQRQPAAGAIPAATPDEATIEALRSLGYLAPGKEHSSVIPNKTTPTVPAAKKSPPPPGGTKRVKSPTLASPTSNATPSPSETPAAAPSPTPEEAATPSPTPAAPSIEATPQESPLAWRVIPVAKAPGQGRDYQVIRTSQEWAALFEDTGAPPSIGFDGEMVVLLRYDLVSDPPARLVVASVNNTGGELLIECRRQQPESEAGPATPASAGQALVVPISDLPIRVVVR